jgi:hypothetical protein
LYRDSLVIRWGVNGLKVLFQSDGVGNTMPPPTKAAAMQNIPIYEALAQAFSMRPWPKSSPPHGKM